MARIELPEAGSENMLAFLDTIAYSEGTTRIYGSDDGYNVIVGGSLFEDYSDHPRRLIALPNLGIKSTAAGRYQLLERYFDSYKHELDLLDFSPRSQDLIALQQIKECHAESNIRAGDITSAIGQCSHIWASLPGAGYGQHENSLSTLLAIFENAGGTLA